MMDKNRYLIGLSESPRTAFGRLPYDQQAPEQRVFTAIWGLESEVTNGGFAHYYTSDHEGAAADAASALARIGARNASAIVADAMRILGSPAASREARTSRSEHLSEDEVARLQSLDEAFMAYPDNLTSLLFAFVQAHPAVFGEIGDGAV